MPISKLLEGFATFRSTYTGEGSLYAELVEKGQSPETLVIACSDSRNDPALLMQSQPGDIFVVRNVAAIVPPYQPDNHYHGTSAAIEFAVKGLKVRNIVVLGHALCGGVRALAHDDGQNHFEFLDNWVRVGIATRDAIMAGLKDADEAVRLRALEQAMILTSLNNLMTFPWIAAQVEQQKLHLYGWYFDMGAGQLMDYDYAQGIFINAQARPDWLSRDVTHTGECCARFAQHFAQNLSRKPVK